ncbi:MAG TPA: serine/threonine-protein kinase [Pirellulales bacterium]|jgi:serine/threonine-protein kinase|nr:serine/threonine-protein kinase [Pirellulales bacterium]
MGLRDLFKASTKVNVRSRFELLREAISGTMSNFYMARDRTTDQIVGLKVLDLEKTAALESRFVGVKKPKEGDIALAMVHPRIVRTMEHGMTTGGEQFLVMEFLEGPGLNSLIVGRSAELAGRRMNLIRQAAEALAAVHGAGYIHRDICPRNFVLDKDCQSLKLIDFGLTVPATAPFMQPGNRTGTANYMAPEVVRRRPTSQRLDIFAFGVMAYELCAFELPWPRGAGLAAMAHGSQEPTDIREFCPKIDPRLQRAIYACLEPTPDKRPASMEEFLKMIKHVEHENA